MFKLLAFDREISPLACFANLSVVTALFFPLSSGFDPPANVSHSNLRRGFNSKTELSSLQCILWEMCMPFTNVIDEVPEHPGRFFQSAALVRGSDRPAEAVQTRSRLPTPGEAGARAQGGHRGQPPEAGA
jgi:hypothetical protein